MVYSLKTNSLQTIKEKKNHMDLFMVGKKDKEKNYLGMSPSSFFRKEKKMFRKEPCKFF